MWVRIMCKYNFNPMYDPASPFLPRRSVGHPRLRWDDRILNLCWKIWHEYRGRHWFDILSNHYLNDYEDEHVLYIVNLWGIDVYIYIWIYIYTYIYIYIFIRLVAVCRVFCSGSAALLVIVSLIDSNGFSILSSSRSFAGRAFRAMRTCLSVCHASWFI